MDGLGRAIGGDVVISLCGENYTVSPLTLKDFGTIEQTILQHRPRAMELIRPYLADMDPDMQKTAWEVAIKEDKANNKVSPEEINAYLGTMEGLKFSLYLSLSKKHPSLTFQSVCELIDAEAKRIGEQAVANLRRQRDVASGIDEMGNSTGS